MSKLSLFDKIKILIDVTSSSGLFMMALLLVVSMAYIFATTNKKNAKSSKIAYLIIYALIMIAVGIMYGGSIGTMFDYMMNNFFVAVYFPNLAVYFAAIIATNIILWVSMFNFKVTKLIKRINVVVYSILHYLLILIINVITTKKLDVFKQKSVYENKQALGLIELSSAIFVIWIIFLIIYRLIRKYQTKKEPEKVKVIKKRIIPSNINVVKHPTEVNDITEEKTILPENINVLNHPESIKLETKDLLTAEKPVILPNNINIVKHPSIIKEDIEPVVEKTPTMDEMFSVDDYKLVLKLLKEYKEKEYKETEEKLKKIKEDELRYKELEDIYHRAHK
ncbi:MAG: hypothetical protein IJI43_04740 [Bacilli bacterium]|nr:hypothetical protein [Bacilli bacterium]